MKKSVFALSLAVLLSSSIAHAEPLIPVIDAEKNANKTKITVEEHKTPLFSPNGQTQTIDPNAVYIVVNNVPIFFENETDKPFIDKQGRTQVPVRFVSEALHKKVDWEGKTQTVSIDGKVKLRINSSVVEVGGGRTLHMDTVARLQNDRTFVPVRFVSEALGQKVEWDEVGRTVIIETPKGGN